MTRAMIALALMAALSSGRAEADDLADMASELAAADEDILAEVYLADPDETWRIGAAKELARRKATSDLVVNALLTALGDGSHAVRSAATQALTELNVPLVPRLAERVASSSLSDTGRKAALRVLGDLGLASADAIPTILSVVRDKDDPLRPEAVLSLGMIGFADASVLRELSTAITNVDDERLRHAGGRALCHLGSDGTRILRDMSRHERAEVRDVVAVQLGSAKPSPEAIGLLSDLISDPDRSVGEHAAQSLGELGKAAEHALPALIEASREGNVSAKWATRAIGQDLHSAGRAPWWVLTHLYLTEAAVSAIAVVSGSFLLARRLRRRFNRWTRIALVGAAASTLSAAAVLYVLSQEWVAVLLPTRYPLAATELRPFAALSAVTLSFVVAAIAAITMEQTNQGQCTSVERPSHDPTD